ncbi:MAG TPA: substrate-binding domain-containing protein [Anaerolineales bacterium]
MKPGILEKFRLAVIIGVAMLLYACLAPPAATPPPTLHPLQVALTPSLTPARAALHACAGAHPEIALILAETPAASLDIAVAEFALWFGPPPATSYYAAPLAREDILVVVNADNPVSAISTRSLSAIFSAHIDAWQDVGGEELGIEVWILPEGDEFTQVFQEKILENGSFSTLAHLAPDAAAMVEAIRDDPAAIGFLPRAWLSEGVKPLRLDNRTRMAMQQPVLALFEGEPDGLEREFVNCLQSGEGHSVLLERYGAWE